MSQNKKLRSLNASVTVLTIPSALRQKAKGNLLVIMQHYRHLPKYAVALTHEDVNNLIDNYIMQLERDNKEKYVEEILNIMQKTSQ